MQLQPVPIIHKNPMPVLSLILRFSMPLYWPLLFLIIFLSLMTFLAPKDPQLYADLGTWPPIAFFNTT